MNTVLMISYFLPPLGGIVAWRNASYARYLPEFGWRPVLLSVRESPYPLRDPELAKLVPPQAGVFRAATVEPEHLYGLYRRLLKLWQKATTAVPADRLSNKPTSSLAARLQALLCIPDSRIGWLPFAVAMARRIIRDVRPAAIYSISAPFTAHLIANYLARRTGLPWVMEFQDPWLDNHFNPPPTAFHRALVRHMESACIRRANRVVCVTPSMTEDLSTRYADQPTDKFVTITNGFEPDDFEAVIPDPRYFLIRHVGSLYSSQSGMPFLGGLALALDLEPTLKQVLQVEFIGALDWMNEQAIRSFVAAHGLEDHVALRSFVPHREAVRLMQESQVLLLILGEGDRVNRIYPGKIFEYLGARRPILAVAPPGVASSLVKELKAGLVADPQSPESVAETLLALYQSFRRGELVNWSTGNSIEAFEHRNLTRRLALLLDDLIAESRG